ncbi:MAG: hypothetical protein ABIQ27_03295 [Flavobacterium sp.]|uniref:hypothetical protein n=1 Tax=Flavobacterium sp. TaxID=239 RepID=UPI0032672657
MDDNQLYRTLFLIKDFLTEHKETEFKSFDLTDNPNQLHGDSYKIPVDSASDVMYFLKHYKLDTNQNEESIIKLFQEKNIRFDKVYLTLLLQ